MNTIRVQCLYSSKFTKTSISTDRGVGSKVKQYITDIDIHLLYAFLIRIDDVHDPAGALHNVCQTAEGLLLAYDSEQDVVEQHDVHLSNHCLHLDCGWCRSFHLGEVEAFPVVTVEEDRAMLGQDPVHLP